MKYSLESKPGHPAQVTLDIHVRDLAGGGPRLVGIAEVGGAKRTGILPDGEGEDTVKLRLWSFEPALGPDAAARLLQAALALKALRGAEGTLTGDLDVEVAEHTMSRLAGMIGFEEAARLKVGVRHWLDILERLLSRPKKDLVADEIIDEAKLVTMGLEAVLAGVTQPADPAHDDAPPSGVDPDTGEVPEGWATIEGGEETPTGWSPLDDPTCGRVLAVTPEGGGEPFGVRCVLLADHVWEHAGLGQDGQSYQWPTRDTTYPDAETSP